LLAAGLVVFAVAASATSAPAGEQDRIGLPEGERIPDVTLRDGEGREVALREVIRGKPALLVFFRGGWCPFCTTHLAEVGKIAGKLSDAGVPILAISPDRPQLIAARTAESDLPYTLFSDSRMDAAKGFRIAFQVDADLVRTYREKHRIDLEGASGEDHHLLPHPAVFVIDAAGIIRFAHVNPDYRARLSGEEILDAVRATLRENQARSR